MDGVGGGAGGYVEVLRGEAEKEVANTAAGEEGLVAGGAEGAGDVERGGVGRVKDEGVGHRALSLDAGGFDGVIAGQLDLKRGARRRRPVRRD